ncbi:MAG: hypothetical protein ACUVRK_02300, partial [Spirochaetota bacterium]
MDTYPNLYELSVEHLLANLATIPENIRTIVRNYGGGHYNHSLFLKVLGGRGGLPLGQVLEAITKTFVTVEKFIEEFSNAAEKYYLTDIGLLNATIGYKENLINAYLENIIYLELKKREYRVNIGKIDNYEIDFIAENRNGKIYINVSYLLYDNNVREREYRPL